MSQDTSYYCNNVREGAAYNRLMARMLKTSHLRCDVVRISAKPEQEEHVPHYEGCRAVFLNRRAAARYRALASIIPGRERFSWN